MNGYFFASQSGFADPANQENPDARILMQRRGQPCDSVLRTRDYAAVHPKTNMGHQPGGDSFAKALVRAGDCRKTPEPANQWAEDLQQASCINLDPSRG